MDIAMSRKKGDACKTSQVDVLLKADGTVLKAWREDVYVIPDSVGGDTTGVQIPFTVYNAGNRVEDGVKARADNIKDILKSLVLSCDKLRTSIDTLSASMSEGFKSVGSGAKDAANGIEKLESAEKKAKKQAEDLNDIHIDRADDIKEGELPKSIEWSGKGGYDSKAIEYIENYVNRASSAIENLKSKAEEYKRQLKELEEAGKYFDNSDEYQDAITYVGMFIAALTGKNSFTRAKVVQQDFADTYGETAKNAEEATDSINDQSEALKDAANEAEGYLSPIDEINKIPEEDYGYI
nr:hypothetical protein HCOI_01824200 [Haemonchus contortus]